MLIRDIGCFEKVKMSVVYMRDPLNYPNERCSIGDAWKTDRKT